MKLFCMPLERGTQVIKPLSKPTERVPPRVNPQVNWTLGDCDVSVLVHQLSQVSHSGGDVGRRGGCWGGDAGGI